MDLTRRETVLALPALFAALQAAAQESKSTLPTKIFRGADLSTKTSGALSYRNMFSGRIFEGCQISMHQSELAGHSIPHQPHKHRHEEMVLVTEGALEFTIGGVSTRAGAGSALFAGSGEMHGIRNPDDAPAKYYVFALGPENE